MRWNKPTELVTALEDNYPDEDLSSLRATEIYDLILSLPEFEDDPDEATDVLLKSILESWKELREERNG
jgi:FeS assembly protein IscX